jgi:cysteine desulfuration protein SufE
MRLDKLIRRFRAADKQTRLEALLDASRKLPELPARLKEDRDRESHRVPECQTPVFLWLEPDGDVIRFHADVPRESPTVRGFVSLLAGALDGSTPREIAEVPLDLLHLMGLDETLGMMRSQGLSAVTRRVKRAGELLSQRGPA